MKTLSSLFVEVSCPFPLSTNSGDVTDGDTVKAMGMGKVDPT